MGLASSIVVGLLSDGWQNAQEVVFRAWEIHDQAG